jgi:archaellum component FlaC
MFRKLFGGKDRDQSPDLSTYVSAIQESVDNGGDDLKARQERFENFQGFVKDSITWFKEIQDRRFKGESLSPFEKALVMQYETMASQYITYMYKLFNLITKTKNYHETISKTKEKQIQKTS